MPSLIRRGSLSWAQTRPELVHSKKKEIQAKRFRFNTYHLSIRKIRAAAAAGKSVHRLVNA
jgi:hypothetical protein